MSPEIRTPPAIPPMASMFKPTPTLRSTSPLTRMSWRLHRLLRSRASTAALRGGRIRRLAPSRRKGKGWMSRPWRAPFGLCGERARLDGILELALAERAEPEVVVGVDLGSEATPAHRERGHPCRPAREMVPEAAPKKRPLPQRSVLRPHGHRLYLFPTGAG